MIFENLNLIRVNWILSQKLAKIGRFQRVAGVSVRYSEVRKNFLGESELMQFIQLVEMVRSRRRDFEFDLQLKNLLRMVPPCLDTVASKAALQLAVSVLGQNIGVLTDSGLFLVRSAANSYRIQNTDIRKAFLDSQRDLPMASLLLAIGESEAVFSDDGTGEHFTLSRGDAVLVDPRRALRVGPAVNGGEADFVEFLYFDTLRFQPAPAVRELLDNKRLSLIHLSGADPGEKCNYSIVGEGRTT